jgi:nucleotide-binding universal stress UspA family protein
MNTILIAVDGSPASREAIEFGVELAQDEGAEVVFVHVVPSYDLIAMNGFGLAGAMPHETTAYDENILVEAETVAEHRGVRAHSKILHGDTVDEIVTYADNLDADMIVVGSRGHGLLASTLLGSVSRGVLGESKRPVVVVRDSSAHERSRVFTHAH